MSFRHRPGAPEDELLFTRIPLSPFPDEELLRMYEEERLQTQLVRLRFWRVLMAVAQIRCWHGSKGYYSRIQVKHISHKPSSDKILSTMKCSTNREGTLILRDASATCNRTTSQHWELGEWALQHVCLCCLHVKARKAADTWHPPMDSHQWVWSPFAWSLSTKS